MNKILAPLAAAAVLYGGSAFADTTLPQSVTIASTLTDFSKPLTLPKFDLSLGTLTSVRLQFSSAMDTTLTVQNEALTSSDGTAQTMVQVLVQDSGNNLATANGLAHFGYNPQVSFSSMDYDGSYSLGAGQSTTIGTLSTSSGLSDRSYTGATILSEFSGNGNIDLTALTFTKTLLGNTGGNTSASQITMATVTGIVTYTYTPVSVPEPCSIALLGLGAMGLAARRRKN